MCEVSILRLRLQNHQILLFRSLEIICMYVKGTLRSRCTVMYLMQHRLLMVEKQLHHKHDLRRSFK